MESFTQKEIEDALQFVSSSIVKCEKMQMKFTEGTSQHSLLKNRIQALSISKYLIGNDEKITTYTLSDLEKALPPVISIISKTKKAQSKYEIGSMQFKRFMPIISAMHLSKTLIEEEILNRNRLEDK